MLGWLCWWRPPCVRRRVIVNLQHDPTEAFEGLLWSSWGPWLTLKDVSAHKADPATTVKILGDVVIHRSNLAYLQVLL